LSSIARFDLANRGGRHPVQPHTFYARPLVFDKILAQPHFAVVNIGTPNAIKIVPIPIVVATFGLIAVAQPAQNFGVAKMLDLGEQQCFCLGRRFSKRKMTRYAKSAMSGVDN